jgi:hypothetical protein
MILGKSSVISFTELNWDEIWVELKFSITVREHFVSWNRIAGTMVLLAQFKIELSS